MDPQQYRMALLQQQARAILENEQQQMLLKQEEEVVAGRQRLGSEGRVQLHQQPSRLAPSTIHSLQAQAAPSSAAAWPPAPAAPTASPGRAGSSSTEDVINSILMAQSARPTEPTNTSYEHLLALQRAPSLHSSSLGDESKILRLQSLLAAADNPPSQQSLEDLLRLNRLQQLRLQETVLGRINTNDSNTDRLSLQPERQVLLPGLSYDRQRLVLPSPTDVLRDRAAAGHRKRSFDATTYLDKDLMPVVGASTKKKSKKQKQRHFPLPPLQEKTTTTTAGSSSSKSQLQSFHNVWDELQPSPMQKELFLRRLQRKQVPMVDTRSVLLPTDEEDNKSSSTEDSGSDSDATSEPKQQP